VAVYYPTAAGEQVRVKDISWHNPDLVLLYSGDSRIFVHRENLVLVVRYEPVLGEVPPKLDIGFKPGQ
jgi:hypothetical protein